MGQVRIDLIEERSAHPQCGPRCRHHPVPGERPRPAREEDQCRGRRPLPLRPRRPPARRIEPGRTDPADSINTTLNPRFPGQYYDKEVNTHYNYFRDYDPSTGRYVQSDPIGLRGGVNTYSYVEGNPVTRIDPSGLLWINGKKYVPPSPNSVFPRRTPSIQCVCKPSTPSSPPPNPGNILAGSAAGFAGIGGLLGGAAGLTVGIGEVGHFGIVGGLVVSEALVSGTFAGILAGGAVGVVVGGVVIGGLYITGAFDPPSSVSVCNF
ncbi:MAG: RHS repeat-associated core domain-containing protein [Rhodocyclales bacterium]|nr:RHS repeat-associated core domain-containing protein [Rhodocyclales bacterium]